MHQIAEVAAGNARDADWTRVIADKLADLGHVAGENRVARLRSQERIWSIHAKKRGLNGKVGP